MINKLKRAFKLILSDPREFSNQVIERFRPIVRRKYRSSYSMTLAEWLLFQHRHIILSEVSWMGVPTYKNVLDAWIFQEIIYEVQPDVIVEIGSASGGSTKYLANLLDIIGKGQVISIDIDRTNYHVKHKRITEITGDSASPEVIAKVSDLCKNKIVMVIHDGDHHKEHVLKDLRAYSVLVSSHSYFIVEDGIVDVFNPGNALGWSEEGPLAAIETFLNEDSHFVVDAQRERYILTNNQKGYLKRVS